MIIRNFPIFSKLAIRGHFWKLEQPLFLWDYSLPKKNLFKSPTKPSSWYHYSRQIFLDPYLMMMFNWFYCFCLRVYQVWTFPYHFFYVFTRVVFCIHKGRVPHTHTHTSLTEWCYDHGNNNNNRTGEQFMIRMNELTKNDNRCYSATNYSQPLWINELKPN